MENRSKSERLDTRPDKEWETTEEKEKERKEKLSDIEISKKWH